MARDAVDQILGRLRSNDPVVAMEAAKALISLHEVVHPDLLIQILEVRKPNTWSRIAAAYVLGFLEYVPQSLTVKALLQVLNDRTEPELLRSHVAEALGNLGAVEAISSLKTVARNSDESNDLRYSCTFALSELSSGRD